MISDSVCLREVELSSGLVAKFKILLDFQWFHASASGSLHDVLHDVLVVD